MNWLIVAYFGCKHDPYEVSSLRGLENMCQVCYICHKIRYDEAAAFGEQMSVCTSLGVTNVFYD